MFRSRTVAAAGPPATTTAEPIPQRTTLRKPHDRPTPRLTPPRARTGPHRSQAARTQRPPSAANYKADAHRTGCPYQRRRERRGSRRRLRRHGLRGRGVLHMTTPAQPGRPRDTTAVVQARRVIMNAATAPESVAPDHLASKDVRPSARKSDPGTGRLDTSGQEERQSTRASDARTLTVDFDVRHVRGQEGDLLAARQAKAIAALLAWADQQRRRLGDSADEEDKEAA